MGLCTIASVFVVPGTQETDVHFAPLWAVLDQHHPCPGAYEQPHMGKTKYTAFLSEERKHSPDLPTVHHSPQLHQVTGMLLEIVMMNNAHQTNSKSAQKLLNVKCSENLLFVNVWVPELRKNLLLMADWLGLASVLTLQGELVCASCASLLQVFWIFSSEFLIAARTPLTSLPAQMVSFWGLVLEPTFIFANFWGLKKQLLYS